MLKIRKPRVWCTNSTDLTGVWYRLKGMKDFKYLGQIFKGIRIIGNYGCLSVNGWWLCFDPKEYIYVWWRDFLGQYHRDGWFP